MAKSELYNPLIPIVLVTGILSGSLWRGTPPADTGKPGDPASSGEKSDGASLPVPWVSDLRPVLESLDAALGARASGVGASPLTAATGVMLEEKGRPRDQQILDAMVRLRTGLDRLSSPAEPATCGDGTALQGDANVLGAWMLADDGGDGKTRAAEARTLLDEYRDWRLLADLATGVKKSRESTGHPVYSVDFIVATIPDYVDSNSGWLADQALAATQSAMVQENYLSLFASMLCLVSLTAAHLLYVFNGRASLLTVDMLAVAATALSAVWILVDMERDHVLSRLRTTTPGRVDINWDFIKRIAIYGVLPLMAVIASLFPEVGGTLFGWLEPLRKLSSF